MKKNRFILMFLMLSLLVGGLTSCQADDENLSLTEELTAADIFVASEKYQNYLKVKRKDYKKMDKILFNLTSEERDEYNRLRYLVPGNEEEFNEIVQAISVVIGIDYKAQLMKQFELQRNTFQGTDFTLLELLQAQQRYNIHQSTIPRTRSYEERVLHCKYSCDYFAAVAESSCPSSPDPNSPYYDPDTYKETIHCLQGVYNQRDDCYLNCYALR